MSAGSQTVKPIYCAVNIDVFRSIRPSMKQVRRLWQPPADPAVGWRPVRPSCRQAHRRRLSSAGGQHLPFSRHRFRRSRVERGCAGLRAIMYRTRCPGGSRDFTIRQRGACLGVFRRLGAGARCPPPGHGHHQPYLLAHPAIEARVLRPPVPQSGYDAQGRLWQPGRSCASLRPRHLCILHIIALPLQKLPRENGCSVFVDAKLRPFDDQWAFLAAIQPMAPHDIESAILRATGGGHPLDVTFLDEEDVAKPWQRSTLLAKKLSGASMPRSLTVTLANLVYFEKAQLPPVLANRLIRLAAFQNPAFYKAQAMRLSVWGQTARDRLCRELSAAHCLAARMSGCRAGVAERQRYPVRTA